MFFSSSWNGTFTGSSLWNSLELSLINESFYYSQQDYGWNTEQKSLVLSSFFWGYTVGQVPSGYIAGIWSGQKLLSVGMLICGLLNVVTPIVARHWNLVAVCVCRVGMGLSQACLLPCIHTLLSKWAPPSERARLGEDSFKFG